MSRVMATLALFAGIAPKARPGEFEFPEQRLVVTIDGQLSPGTKIEFEFKLGFCFQERGAGEPGESRSLPAPSDESRPAPQRSRNASAQSTADAEVVP